MRRQNLHTLVPFVLKVANAPHTVTTRVNKHRPVRKSNAQARECFANRGVDAQFYRTVCPGLAKLTECTARLEADFRTLRTNLIVLGQIFECSAQVAKITAKKIGKNKKIPKIFFYQLKNQDGNFRGIQDFECSENLNSEITVFFQVYLKKLGGQK